VTPPQCSLPIFIYICITNIISTHHQFAWIEKSYIIWRHHIDARGCGSPRAWRTPERQHHWILSEVRSVPSLSSFLNVFSLHPIGIFRRKGALMRRLYRNAIFTTHSFGRSYAPPVVGSNHTKYWVGQRMWIYLEDNSYLFRLMTGTGPPLFLQLLNDNLFNYLPVFIGTWWSSAIQAWSRVSKRRGAGKK